MADSPSESQSTDSSEDWHNALSSMVGSLTGALKDLPHWQRMGGLALVVAVIPITLVVYFLSSDPNKLILLSSIFLAWISSLIFLVYIFTERQNKLKNNQRSLAMENTKLEDLRASLLDAVEDKHQSLLEIESRLTRISVQVGELLQEHPGISPRITQLRNSVDTLIRDIQEHEGGYDSFLQLMSGTESMRESKSIAASILASRASKKSSV